MITTSSTDSHLSTGATGYIGGTVFDTIVKAHPEYDVTVLLRNVPAEFEKRYPNVKIVTGDYDSFDIISDAASEADIVVRTTRFALNLRANSKSC